MRILTIFSPALVVGAKGNIPISSRTGSYYILMNESPANLNFTFPDGSVFYVASYDRRKVCFTGQMSQPNGLLVWLVQSIPLSLVLLANQVVIEEYEPGEVSPEVYPSPLFRQLRAFS